MIDYRAAIYTCFECKQKPGTNPDCRCCRDYKEKWRQAMFLDRVFFGIMSFAVLMIMFLVSCLLYWWFTK